MQLSSETSCNNLTFTVLFSIYSSIYRYKAAIHCSRAQSTYVPRVPQCLSPIVRIGTPPPPLPQANVSSPGIKGGTHSPAGEGVGGSQNGRLEKKPSTRSTLCSTSGSVSRSAEKANLTMRPWLESLPIFFIYF
jgi:hypothetical protein